MNIYFWVHSTFTQNEIKIRECLLPFNSKYFVFSSPMYDPED
jgi:hypothetical protein